MIGTEKNFDVLVVNDAVNRILVSLESIGLAISDSLVIGLLQYNLWKTEKKTFMYNTTATLLQTIIKVQP